MVGLASVLMAVVSVPEFRSARDTFKEIDPAQLTQLRPDPPPEQPTEQPEEELEEPQEESETTPERIEAPDLQLSSPTQEPSPQAAAADAQSEAAAEASSGGGEVSVERTQVGGLGASESSRSPAAAALPNAPSQPSGGSGSGAGIAVEETGAGPPGSGGEDASANGAPLAAGSEEVASEGDAAAVTIQDASQEDYTSVEAGKLIQWMRQNPAALPRGISQLVGYQPSFLSSKISDLSTSQGEYEMYLMCKPDLREIHVVLVQGGEAKYLVDRSFQKQSRKFRVGPIRRSGGTIIGVQTRAQSRGQKSKQFYSVFLSWWEEAKADV
jgi:hypothetical protein